MLSVQEWDAFDAKLEQDLEDELKDPKEVVHEQLLKLERRQILEAYSQVCKQIRDNFDYF